MVTESGLEVGHGRFLHPGPLRWLRAIGWMLLLSFVFGFGYALIQGLPNEVPFDTLRVLAVCVVLFGLYAVIVWLCEGQWPPELKLSAAPLELLAGGAVGTAMMAVVVGLLCLIGVYEVSGPHAGAPWRMATIAIESGFIEELLFRAIIARLMMRAFGAWPSLVLQAALFGAVHMGNPNATPVAAVAIAVEAGLMLAAFYMLTGRLWVSIGVHAAWNFTQGWLWGAPVSGTPRTPSLLISGPKPGAPEFLSGGAFGPEASLPCIVVGTSMAIVVLWWAWKKGNFKAKPDPAT